MQHILWMSSKELVLVNRHCSQFIWSRWMLKTRSMTCQDTIM